MRDRLIDLIAKGRSSMWGKTVRGIKERTEYLADYLLKNNVKVLPCKVGQTIYRICRNDIEGWNICECSIFSITIYTNDTYLNIIHKEEEIAFAENISHFGKTIFSTKEEAERALEGGEVDG